jgi:alpha-glucosidase
VVPSSTTLAPLVEATTPTTERPPTTTLPPTTTTTLPPNECVVGAPPAALSAEGFYAKHCTVLGLDVVAAEEVSPDAVTAVAERVSWMLALRPDLVTALQVTPLHIAVIGAEQTITTLPEFEELYELYPGTDWHRLGRSFPGTDLIPVAAAGEENLLCLEGDRYEGEDIFVRDFARTIRRFGLAVIDPNTHDAIERSYGRAIAGGLWEDSVAEVNSDQYWAEGSQAYFDANAEADPPDDVHNHVNTREELMGYDRPLFDIAATVYGALDWRPTCP